MAKLKLMQNARVLVGIDISKSRHEVLIAVPGKIRRKRMTILNTGEDFVRLRDVLSGLAPPVMIGFEATGNDHRALMLVLGAAGFHLNFVSSVALVQTREALHKSQAKNDYQQAPSIPLETRNFRQFCDLRYKRQFQDSLRSGKGEIRNWGGIISQTNVFELPYAPPILSRMGRREGIAL